MNAIIIGKSTIEYTVRRNPKSKRMRINVTPGNVEVVIPEDVSPKAVEEFVQRRRRWIFEKVDEIEEAARKLQTDQPTHFRSGAKVLYWGRNVSLSVKRKNVEEIAVDYLNQFIITIPANLPDPDKAIKKHLDRWMKQRLQEEAERFVRRYSKKTGLIPKSVRVKEQKHLWGSLSKDGIININWHLIYAPKQILEYVVAHEICHLKYRNHSKQFWDLLGSIFPNWNECKTWLEKNDSFERQD